ncbi:cell division protein ZipA [Halomonas daqiaonensis]|uniref:Cell division protein ZipA n=1 Tax=Halomonas daqiaonensis TaxID=650850 RepID=A0A1H7WBE1_9GAMM|nr:cell division protein ZipA [Halomonas daqiaonensis]SEM18800.1 cell division protein ZipA [Halomonas daqiaonensis]
MELREWLIILGLALVTLIVIDGVRRLQRQRSVPRLDQAGHDALGPDEDPEEVARVAEINWELPNGGARVVRPADERGVHPMPKLQRQEHPGPSRVLAEFRRHAQAEGVEPAVGRRSAESSDEREPSVVRPVAAAQEVKAHHDATPEPEHAGHASTPRDAAAEDAGPDRKGRAGSADADERREPGLSSLEGLDETATDAGAAPHDTQPLTADPEDHDAYTDEERYRLVDLEGMGDSLKSNSKRVGSSMQRFGASLQKSLSERREHKRSEKARREQERTEEAAREAARRRQAEDEKKAVLLEAETRRREAEAKASEEQVSEDMGAPVDTVAEDASSNDLPPRDDVVRTHPVLERALRHDVNAKHARKTLSQADEIIVISVLARDEEGFSGTALLDLMLACGLRYARGMGIFHRFETEDPDSRLQFSMVNVVKPGSFPIEAMDNFQTPGITLLMPLPGASDTSAAFEAMVETAMVIVRHLGGELKDENQSVMTAQTVEFARQRVQEFERRNRLNRYQVN